MQNPFRGLTKFEFALWCFSVLSVIISFLFLENGDSLKLIASLIGVTALIFTSKGYVIGQILIVVFSLFYGFISFHTRYYGEMITYLGISTPIAILAAISWFKNPYKGTKEVKINKPSKKQIFTMFILATIVTAAFYFILKYLGNAALIVSTVSITTSFIAAYLTVLRSPYYALAYALNDVVLIALWVTASISDPTNIPMLVCFAVFLINDIYGFINWRRMQRKQA